MKLELEHLAPYLPYGLKVIIPYHQDKGVQDLVMLSKYRAYLSNGGSIHLWQEQYIDKIKPILRPLSDINREEMEIIRGIGLFKTKKEQWENSHWSFIREVKAFPTLQKYSVISKLFEWHFDVFELINKGLAIDTNTLK